MKKIVGFGEVLMRLTPSDQLRYLQTDKFNVYYGGSEANATGACADWGDKVSFITKLPDHDIGEAALNTLRFHHLDTEYVVRGGERLGIYFCEDGSSIRNSKVIYDRKNSSIATAKAEEFDFDSAMKGADWFHFSGITAALSEEMVKALHTACRTAKKYGLTVSCDLNYRAKLWTAEEAQKVMIPLMEYVDVCIANEADAVCCLGTPKGLTPYEMAEELVDRFHFKYVLTADQDNRNSQRNIWTAILRDDENTYVSKTYDVAPILDRVGCGDALAGGIIHALLKWNDLQMAVEFASAAGVLKETVRGDMSFASEEEVIQLMNQKAGGISR